MKDQIDNNIETSRSIAKKTRTWLKSHKVKSPESDFKYSPDGGKTNFFAKDEKGLIRLKRKYPKK